MNNNQCLVLVFCLNDSLDCELFEAKDLILQKEYCKYCQIKSKMTIEL